MPRSLTRNLRRRGALPAFIVAAAIAAWLVLVSLANIALDLLASLPFDAPDASADAARRLALLPAGIATDVLPQVLGIFVSLWILAPVAGSLQLRFVIARAALAAGVGAAFSVVVHIVVAMVGLLVRWWAGSFGWGNPAADAVVSEVTRGVSLWLNFLPIVVLAVVFLWLWLRDREPKHPVAGIIDEV